MALGESVRELLLRRPRERVHVHVDRSGSVGRHGGDGGRRARPRRIHLRPPARLDRGGGMTSAPAISVSRATKLYRRYGRKRSIGTLKTALLSGIGRGALAPDTAVPALVDVSFEVAAGETVGVIGPN